MHYCAQALGQRPFLRESSLEHIHHVLHLHLRVATTEQHTCWRPLPTHTRPVVRMGRKHMFCSAVGAVDRRGQQNTLFVTLWFRAYWSQLFAEFYRCLRVARMPRSRDLADDRQNRLRSPCPQLSKLKSKLFSVQYCKARPGDKATSVVICIVQPSRLSIIIAILSKSGKGHQVHMCVAMPTHVARGRKTLQTHGFPSLYKHMGNTLGGITLILRCE